MTAEVGPPRRIRDPRRLTVAAVVVVALVIGIGVWVWAANREGVRFAARFSASVGVYPGSDVRILGVPVGRVDSVTPDGASVEIAMHLDPGVVVAADTAAVIVSPNLVSDRYVQLTGVYDVHEGGARLASGTVIPLSRTRTPVELDQLYHSLIQLTGALGPHGANSTGAFSRLLKTGAANLGGNGAKINSTIKQFSDASGTLASSKNHFFGTIRNLASFTAMLKTNNDGLIRVNQELASVSGTLADDRQSFAEALHELGTALGLVQRFVHDNRDALSTNVAKLNDVARTLALQRSSLEQALRAAPLLVQNFTNTYDAKNNVLRGRVNLNELTVWAQQAADGGFSTDAATGGGTTSSGTTSSGATSGATSSGAAAQSSGGATPGAAAPPAGLLPAANVTTGGGS